MPSVKFVVRHETVFGYKVFMFIRGWDNSPEMTCVRSGPVTWETTLHFDSHPTIYYKYFFAHPSEPHQRFFEDGPDREHVVTGSWERVDNWRQTSSCVVNVILRDQAGTRITQCNQPCDFMTAHIILFPPHKAYIQQIEQVPIELHLQRRGSGGHGLVWEHMLFRLARVANLERYELSKIPILVNDDFWNVGKVMVAEFHAIFHDADSQGKFCGPPRGSKFRYQFFNRHEDWVSGVSGVRLLTGGDDSHVGRAQFEGRLHVTERPKMWCNFSRREGCRHTLLHLIHTAQTSIHASIYNINDPEVSAAIVAAKRRGLDVQILTSSKFMLRDWQLNKEYKVLVREGVFVLAVIHDNPDPSLRAITNHTKFAVFDRYKVVTGSCNWEQRAFDSNSENIVCVEQRQVAQVYECIFDAIRGRPPLAFPQNHSDSIVKVYYSRSWRRSITKPVCRAIDQATHRIDLAMFIIRPLVEWEDGTKWDLFASLRAAHQRGVEIWALLETNTHDGGLYKDRTLPADTEHQALLEMGIHCLKLRPVHNNDPCSALHHKFIVLDGQTTITGSFNLWGPSLVSDDDLIIINDSQIAREHQREMKRLLEWYMPSQTQRYLENLSL